MKKTAKLLLASGPSSIRKRRSVVMDFEHPLARGAKIWEAKLRNGETKRILVVITNEELNENKKRYNPVKIKLLVAALKEFIEAADVDGYILANRLRNWEKSKDR